MLSSSGKKRGKAKSQQREGSGTEVDAVGASGDSAVASVGLGQSIGTVKIYLNFKRYIFDPNKRMIQ